MLYGWLASFAPTFTAFVWDLSPTLNLRDPGLVGSGGFLLCYAVFLLGSYLCGRANRIKLRVAETMRRVEEMMWQEALRVQVRHGLNPADAVAKLNINISLAGAEPAWYQRFWGLVLLGIVLPMAVEVLKVVVGLAKLP